MPTPPRISILAALESECRAIRRAIGNRSDVEILCIGIRAAHSPEKIFGEIVILAGLGGALDPSLKIGDLVLDGVVPPAPSQANLWQTGKIATAAQLVTTPAQKQELFRATGARIVDMERAVIRETIPKRQSFISLRAVSDTADMAVNPAILRMIDSRGRPRPLAAMSVILRHPGIIPHLRQLEGNTRIALHNLGLGIVALLDRFPLTPDVAYAPADVL